MKKPSLAVVIGMGKPKGKPSDGDDMDDAEESESSDDVELEAAASEVRQALKGDDDMELARALKAFMDCC